MPTINVRRATYYYLTVPDQPGEAYRLLSALAEAGIELLSFSVVPTGPTHTQLFVFPADPVKLEQVLKRSGSALTGPLHAFIVQGKDDPGALVDLHERLSNASVNIYAANAVSSGRVGLGYVFYVRPEQYEHAASVLGL